MDPCDFVRLTVSNLALKLPIPAPPTTRALIHPTSPPCSYCIIKLKGFSPQTATIPYIENNHDNHPHSYSLGATFHLSKDDITTLTKKSLFTGKRLLLKISIFTGKSGPTCGLNKTGRLIGKVSLPLDLNGAESKAVIYHNGWTVVGKEATPFHMIVRADPDPRFVFQFEGDPECSPQVFQIKGRFRQPVFTCNFSSLSHRLHHPSRSMEQGSGKKWLSKLSSFGNEREKQGKERKGWSITIHDLSGSPVAAASMVTPFVASPGSDRVSRSNPGSWLLLRPGEGTWKPWGRLEAWRERGANDGLGCRFEIISDRTANAWVVLAEANLNTAKGGKFLIDLGLDQANSSQQSGTSPRSSPRRGTSDLELRPNQGFVMSACVEGEGKSSKPTVEVGVQYVTCAEDAAAYVALAAAVDLSMDACRLFSQKLRKELCHTNDLGN